MRVGVDHAGEREQSTAVEDLARLARRDLRREEGEASVFDAEVESLHRGRSRAHDAHVLDDEVERRHTTAIASISIR